ncbi:hypothetical protein D3C75_881860 [compost metagenome]
MVTQNIADHQLPPGGPRGGNHSLRTDQGSGERFFNEQMATGSQRRQRVGFMGIWPGGQANRIRTRHRQRLGEITEHRVTAPQPGIEPMPRITARHQAANLDAVHIVIGFSM